MGRLSAIGSTFVKSAKCTRRGQTLAGLVIFAGLAPFLAAVPACLDTPMGDPEKSVVNPDSLRAHEVGLRLGLTGNQIVRILIFALVALSGLARDFG